MLTAIVIPCLNERELIPATTASLGFGEGPPPKDTILVLVDNGSKDGTLAVLKEIQQRADVGLVFVGEELIRGYVPPRAKGIEIATMVADTRNIRPDRLLILQADADTRYSDQYVRAFQTAASNEKRSAMFEGTTAVPHRFRDGHPGFQRLADRVDADMARYLVGEDLDVIVDDKVAGYTLSSYQQWGGLRRDYSADGNEIHAETSRLFMRAKGSGAVRVRVPDAEATPSRRKILRNPIRHFATAGFPRDETWWRRWSNAYDGPRDLAAFEGGGAFGILKSVIKAREAHLLGLFSLLPLLVESRWAEVESLNRITCIHWSDRSYRQMGGASRELIFLRSSISCDAPLMSGQGPNLALTHQSSFEDAVTAGEFSSILGPNFALALRT